MSETFSPVQMIFTKYDKRSSQVAVDINRGRIGYGGFGTVYNADVLISNRRGNFAIKKYRDGLNSAEYNAQRAFRNYEMAKKAGLKVFPTYRLSDDKTHILMTNGRRGNTVCLGHTNPLESQGFPVVPDSNTQSYEVMIKGVLQNVQRATDQGIFVPADAYLFLLDTLTYHGDFVIGDLDGVSESQSERLRMINLNNASYSLQTFFEYNFNNHEPHIKLVNGLFNQARSNDSIVI